MIRHATPADIPAIVALERECPSAAHWSEAQYHIVFEFGATPRLFLVSEESDLIGFIVVRTLGPEWEIENVAVAPKSRRQGTGAQLVHAMTEEAKLRRAESIFLEVRASNAAARALYARCGFTESGRRRGYYAHPDEDAVLYRLHLRNNSPSAP